MLSLPTPTQRKFSQWWALGDLASDWSGAGEDPRDDARPSQGVRATVATLERYVSRTDHAATTQGDRAAWAIDLYGAIQRSFAWTCGALAAHGWLDWLRGLPMEMRIVLPDGTSVLGVHASPGRDDGDGITPHRGRAGPSQRPEAADADLVCTGHTHQPADQSRRRHASDGPRKREQPDHRRPSG